MPATATAAFLELIRKSEILDEEDLDAWLARQTSIPEEPRELAAAMIRDGLITPFQSEHLLKGKWKGFHIGKYRLLQLIGAGGMGRVFLCSHTTMRRLVAVKVLPAGQADEVAVKRFEREARACAAVDHPNIIQAYDIDRADKVHFLVMEYVDGTSLQEIVTRFGPLRVDRACEYIRQAALGLQHAHENGLVHRDIKPGNLLLSRQGVIKILDLGLARFFRDHADKLTARHNADHVLGTADYMAPEQGQTHAVDVRADIYSLGCTFYFLLSGRAPFEEGTPGQKLLWHQLRNPRPLSELRLDIPPALEAILRRMMEKRPGDRYQTPGEVAEALVPWVPRVLEPPPEEEMPPLCPAVRALMQARPAPGTQIVPPSAAVSTLSGPETELPAHGMVTRVPRQRKSAPHDLADPEPPTEALSRPAWSRRSLALTGFWLVVVLAAGLAYWAVFGRPAASPSPTPTAKADPSPTRATVAATAGTPTFSQPAKAYLSPREARQRVGEEVKVEMVVRSVGTASNETIFFLNSERTPSPENLAIVIKGQALKAYKDRKLHTISHFRGAFQDRTIRVQGKVALYNGKPQIEINGPDDIQILR